MYHRVAVCTNDGIGPSASSGDPHFFGAIAFFFLVINRLQGSKI